MSEVMNVGVMNVGQSHSVQESWTKNCKCHQNPEFKYSFELFGDGGQMRCVERGSVIRALPQPGFPPLLGRRPDWDYETRRMVSNRILGPAMFRI